MSASSANTNVYFLTISLIPQKDGLDVLPLIRKISSALTDQPALKIIHKFKVSGETKVIAFIHVTNVIALERTLNKLCSLGPIEVDSQPAICYENFAQNIKVADELCKPCSRELKKDGIYWMDFTVGYRGHTYNEFMAVWKKEAETVLSLRLKGELNMQLFKCLAQRRVEVFMNNDDAAKLDLMSLELPIVVENGENIQIKSKHVQYLDDYIAHINDDKL